ncbi:hypothetical protein ACFOEW_15550 [Alteromonas oceani]|uniref:SMODS and SLOG-associating 2TM effector domain-containing protein n=1 Tax=Alteromonas oceani TaxID=2071609 RepID=A0ABV7K4H6_9ALTE|nr:hypothetical protein [Alteromonas oceani]
MEKIACVLHNYASPNKVARSETERKYHRIANELYDCRENSLPIVRLTSSLAVGADRLGMSADFSKNLHEFAQVEHAAILPFSTSQYRNDFKDSSSITNHLLTEVQEFDQLIDNVVSQSVPRLVELDGDYTNGDSRDAAYFRCSKVLVENCDLIIAIYDGNPSSNENKGHKAGTHSSVQLTLEARKPVIQIDPRGEQQCQIWQSTRFGREEAVEAVSQTAIETLVGRLVLFTDIFRLDEEDASSTSTARENSILRSATELQKGAKYLDFDERCLPDYDYSGPINAKFSTVDKLRGAHAFNWFKQLFFNAKRVSQIKSAYNKNSTVDRVDESNVTVNSDAYFSHFQVADSLAVRYAAIHRSTFFLIYTLAALALISAAVGAIFKDYTTVLYTSVGLKAVALISIYLLYKHDAHNHHMWLQNRCLAEGIRPNVYLSALGRCFSFLDTRSSDEFMHREVLGHGHSGGQWVCIHAEVVARYVGFRQCPMANANYRESAIKFLQNKWLQGQSNYHLDNAAKMKQLGEKLSGWTHWLFYLTAVFLVFKVVFMSIYVNGKVPETSFWYYPSKFTTLSTILFPILASFLFAVRNHAEFDISSQRSLTMLAFFYSMKEYFNRLKFNNSSPTTSSTDALDIGLHKLSDVSVREVSEWIEIYEVKESEPG